MAWGTLLALFVLWILLSGKLDAFHLGLGVASIALVAWLQSRLPSFRGQGAPRLHFFRTVVYIFWLLWQMFIAAIYVARMILGPQSRIDPRLFAFRCKQPSEVNAVVFANSITLTPGTITVDYENDEYVVHALTPQTADDVLEGGMARKVARLSSDEAVSVDLMVVEEGGRLS